MLPPDGDALHDVTSRPWLDQAHKVAEGLGAALNFAAGFNPLCTFFEGVTGQNAAGECVPKWQQAIDLATILLPHIKIPHIPGPRGPKLWPLGPHNEKIAERIDELVKQGMTHTHGGSLTEEKILTPGGTKPFRRIDITMTKADGAKHYEQVGKTMADGSPIKREKKALDDLEKHLGVRPHFTPYDR